MAAADFDRNALPDLAVANPGAGTASTLLNTSDVIPPDTRITAGPTGTTRDRTPTFSFDSPGGGARFECSLDGRGFSACSSPLEASRLSAGRHVFEVRAIDAAGNLDPTPAALAFRIPAELSDLPPPKLGRIFNVEPVGRGEVFVSESPRATRAHANATVPGIKGRSFVPLREARQL